MHPCFISYYTLPLSSSWVFSQMVFVFWCKSASDWSCLNISSLEALSSLSCRWIFSSWRRNSSDFTSGTAEVGKVHIRVLIASLLGYELIDKLAKIYNEICVLMLYTIYITQSFWPKHDTSIEWYFINHLAWSSNVQFYLLFLTVFLMRLGILRRRWAAAFEQVSSVNYHLNM